MSQFITKWVAVQPTVGQDKFNVTIYIGGSDGDPSGAISFVELTTGDIATPTLVGDMLVADFPEIDLPTT